MKKFGILLIALVGFAVSSFGQGTSATASASATIVTPISITKNTDLSFGNVAVNTSAGTVAMTAAASPTRTPSGGVTLPGTAGTVTAAKFTVTGTSGYTYAITLPSGATTLSDGASHTMTVDTWVSTPTPNGTLTGGTEVVYVGGTLHVGASQVAGTYTSTAPFSVSVDYN